MNIRHCLSLSSILVTILFAANLPTQAATLTSVDMIAYGDYLITMDPEAKQRVIRDGAVAISGTDILAVGSREQIEQSYRSKTTLSGKDRILMPGLINGHGHSPMVLFRGMADDLKLMDWLEHYIFPMEAKFVDEEFVKIGAELACWEMLRGGTTSYVDMYFYPNTIAETALACGIRALIASPAIDYPSPGFEGWDDSFAAATQFVEDWQGKHERITPAFGPHAPYSVSPAHIRQVSAAAATLNAPVSMHLAEAPAELLTIKQRYNDTSVRHVEKLGLLKTHLIAAHMVLPSEEEIELLAVNNIGAIHNPTSNLKIAAGIAPVVKLLAAGVAVGLGTDGAASNNDLDMWEEIHLAALIHKQANEDATVLPAYTVLDMATRLGAKAIGLGDVTGILRPGYRADMIQIDLNSPGLTPLYNVISQLVYTVDSSDVITTVVSGKILMSDGEVLSIDADKIRHKAMAKANEIRAALNH